MSCGEPIVIVTGAGQGIGRAMSLGLVRGGAAVVMVDVSGAPLAEAAEAADPQGRGRVLPIVADITCEADVARVLAHALQRFGSVHGLVNNAAIGRATIRPDFMSSPIKLWEIEPGQWRRIVEVNVNGFFLMTRAVMPILLQQAWGRVVSVTTSLDTMFRAGSATYGGSKAAVEAYTATLAEDLAGTAVTANVLVPGGPVDTGMIPQDWAVDRSALIPPAVMVPPVSWLLSRRSDGVSGRRFVAALWDAELDATEAARLAGAPAAWPQLGQQAIIPKVG